MSDHFWNVIGALAIGGALAMLVLAWPFIKGLLVYLDYALTIGSCLAIVLLAVGFFVAHVLRYPRVNGYYSNGIHYGDD